MTMTINIKKTASILAATALSVVLLIGVSGCGESENVLQDGYYTAQVAEPSHGWTEFLTICVNDGAIVSAEFQAKTASGFIKSWDMDYMRTMNAADGTYPNEYVRVYTTELIESQSPDIDVLSGATESYNSFKLLSAAVIEQAKAGDNTVAIVEVLSEH
jgi:major membrane immunogen (membrane-anchored lipoprotein)